MEGAACIIIKPCNIGNLEKHNSRDPEYMARMKHVYVRRDLTYKNETKTYGIVGGNLHAHLDYQRKLVKEKTGRKMQAKATPLREGMLLMSETTTVKDVEELAKAMERRWGMKCIRIDFHRDEGKWENGQWIPNRHAHMVFDWIKHDTGKSVKVEDKEGGMSEVQDMAAYYTGMPRGESKEKTRRKHLGREDWVQKELKRKEAELIELREETFRAEQKLEDIKNELATEKKKLQTVSDGNKQAQDAGKYRAALPLITNYYRMAGSSNIPLLGEVKKLGDNVRYSIDGSRGFLPMNGIHKDVIAPYVHNAIECETLCKGFLMTDTLFRPKLMEAYVNKGAKSRNLIKAMNEIRQLMDEQQSKGFRR